MNDICNRIDTLLEAFKDIGKLSPDQLAKGQKLNPNSENNFTEVTGRMFYTVINKMKANDLNRENQGLPSKGLHKLLPHSAGEYNRMRCFLGKNNSSGYCIDGDELVSVFSLQKSSGDAIVVDAINNGARELSCQVFMRDGKFEGPLYKLYTRHGFRFDNSVNFGKKGEPYSAVKGVFYYPNEDGKVSSGDQRVAIFMKR